MPLQDDGAWTAAFDRNLDGVYYDFIVDFADGASFSSADPWARAAGINGRRSMVVDLPRTDPEGWAGDERPRPTRGPARPASTAGAAWSSTCRVPTRKAGPAMSARTHR